MAKIKWKTEESFLEDLKNAKIQEMTRVCGERIISGFIFEDKIYTYSQEKQINFQDTYMLFINDAISKITWNYYSLSGEKKRVELDKEQFKKVYLEGIKHKTDLLTRLNDVIIPFVKNAQNKETIARVFWDEGIPSEQIKIRTDKMIDNRVDKLGETTVRIQSDALNTMMALLQVSNMITTGDK